MIEKVKQIIAKIDINVWCTLFTEDKSIYEIEAL